MYKPQVPSTSLRAKNRNPVVFFLFLTVKAVGMLGVVDAMLWRPLQKATIGCSGPIPSVLPMDTQFFPSLTRSVFVLAAPLLAHPVNPSNQCWS
jgi:hypothetical protein